ncbi:MAG: hypothetical protein KBT34_02970 [Prevotella sp.]|nr:hypothetical protein [Candidatus Prevotella equi]
MAELPLEVRNKILAILHKNQKWIYYEQRLKEYRKKNNLSGARKMQDILDKLEDDSIANYLQSIEEEKTTLHDLMQRMTEEDREYLQVRLHGVVFMCDIVDNFILDVESVVNKYFPDSSIDTYQNLKQLGAEVKTQVGMILNASNDKNKDIYCKYSDKVVDAALPYIRSFIHTQERLRAKEERLRQRHEK